ncbi:MAG: hypothetical protein J0I32_05735 [Sphingobacteriales bacterium]|nr:hypothetical protein [Sphingobacteriales bacterium]OJW03930.1 MAG: hypothetical protein BGO52_17425 [Sphingobacteriales bacterium 44-61]
MKILASLILVLSFYNCKAQYPVIDITESELGQPDGYYVKDVHNYLNQFEGTYLYSNGTTSFKIMLVKKVQQFNGRYYEDLIIGEYQYIENGVEKVNTLSQINTVYNDQRSHNIDGNFPIQNNNRRWLCPECATGEKRLYGSIKDASTNRYAEIFMRRTVENGQQVMKVKIGNVLRAPLIKGEPVPPDFSLPLGIFTFVKQ